MLLAEHNCEQLAAAIRDVCDMDTSPVAAGLWHAVEGIRALATETRRWREFEAVLARVLEALDEDIA
jgi:hypothetical protein